MDTVENNTRGETLVGKGHANNTRLPGAHGGERLEEMCNSAKPVVDGSYQSVRSRLAVTNRHPNSARSEGLHKSRRHAFWCQGHHGRSDCGELPEPIQIVPGRGLNIVTAMNPRARTINKRTFEMKTQDAVGAGQ